MKKFICLSRDYLRGDVEVCEIKAKDVLDFLPKTNCRDCGLPTCFAFAVALLKGHKRLKDCPALSEPEFAQDKEALARLPWTAISEEVAK
jgi:ArsR family metal-binding transcriptional regulator